MISRKSFSLDSRLASPVKLRASSTPSNPADFAKTNASESGISPKDQMLIPFFIIKSPIIKLVLRSKYKDAAQKDLTNGALYYIIILSYQKNLDNPIIDQKSMILDNGGGKMFSVKGFLSAHVYSWNDSFIFNGESHKEWEIVFVEEGGVISTEEERVYSLTANQIVIHAPWEFHRIRSAEGSSPKLRVTAINIEGQLPNNLKNGVFTLTKEEKEEFIYSFDRIRAVLNGDNISNYEIYESKCRISAFLIRLSNKSFDTKRTNSASAVAYHKVASYMSKSAGENLSIEEIAKNNFMSQSYMKHLFTKYAGLSPKMYYVHQQINRATELLKSGLSIAEVSRRLNFSSPNYFSTFYKKHTGKSPSKLN